MFTGRPSLAIGIVCLTLAVAPLPAAPRVAAPSTVQVFVDPDAGATPVVRFIQQARGRLDAEVYLVTSKPVLAALEAAASRGVDVRVLLEQHPYGTGTAAPALAFRSLQAHGVQVRWSNPAFRYTHAKYMVAPANGAALICTCNWTTSAFARNREVGLIDSAPAVVLEAEAVFTADWTRSTVQGSVADLVVSPLDARADLLRLVTGARRTVDVYAEEVQDGQMIAALSAAQRRGVRVRFITTDASAGTRQLAAAGVQVVLRTTPYIHAKAIVADGTSLFVGSENLSSTSLDKNREMGLILTDRTVIVAVERAFTADLAGATNAPARGATPAAQPSVTPRAGAAPTAAAGTLAVRVSVSPNPMSYGTETTVSARTAAGATCTVAVRYASGHTATSRSLRATETADSGGRVSWTWRVSTRTPGLGTATVTCALTGRSGTGVAPFTVR